MRLKYGFKLGLFRAKNAFFDWPSAFVKTSAGALSGFAETTRRDKQRQPMSGMIRLRVEGHYLKFRVFFRGF
jgi:hypothetical protein